MMAETPEEFRDLAAEELEQAAYDYWWPILAKDEEMNAIDYNDPGAAREAVRKLLAENAKLREALRVACLLASPMASRAKYAREHAQWRKRNIPRDDPANKWWEELAGALEALEDTDALSLG